jgi:hypothetical protein
MHLEASSLHGFPIALFTLSLEKIAHIFDGALAPATPPGATEVVQAIEPGALRQNLRDLKVADATVQLENLAREVGIDLSTWSELPLAQCEGQIISAFRDLQTVYEKLRTDLVGTTSRISMIQRALKSAPADFQYPKNAPPLDKLQARPALIEIALESARGDDVDRLRSEFDAPARLGNFQPLMLRARDLLEEPRGSLALLLGHVISIENAIADYRTALVANVELQRAERGLDALARANGTMSPKPISLKDVEEAGALTEAQMVVSARIQQYAVAGGKLLGESGVSFDRWCAIVTALDAGRDPALEQQEADALVKRSFVQRTYRLGVGS